MVICVMSFGACEAPDGGSRQASAIEADPAGAARERLGVVFDPLAVSAGDSVGALRVVRVDVRRAVTDSTPVGTIAFRGEVALTGRRIPHFDADLAATVVCFEADSLSAARLPRWRGDRRRPWFCFDDATVADSLMGPVAASSAAVRIVIDDFTIHRGLTDQVNSARLVCRGPGCSPQ
jgi:hypothetical protein